MTLVTALVQFSSTTYGNFNPGDRIEIDDGLAQDYAQRGLVEINAPVQEYYTKVVTQRPTATGKDKESSSLPADQASPKKTRGRPKKKGWLSASTTESDLEEMDSTPEI